MDIFEFRPARLPILVSIPHTGICIPQAISASMTPAGRRVPDTDWHLDRLYRFLDDDIGLIVANHSRYVVDLNRPGTDDPLYPGQLSTGLCPAETFDGHAIYRPGREPDARDIDARIQKYWAPYHDQLAAEIARLKQQHGFVILWDAHSIRSRVTRLFDGELPALNIGTNDGESCDALLAERLATVAADSPCSSVLNGRFKGGYITRHYGSPDDGVHAVQLEIAQRCYMQNHETGYCGHRASQLQMLLSRMFNVLIEHARHN